MARDIISRYLSTDGSASGVKDMSTTADEYYIRDANNTLVIHRMLVSYQDGGGGLSNEYGNLNVPLSVGIELKTTRRDGSTVIADLTDGLPVKQNADWARLCYDFKIHQFSGGDDIFTARWTFKHSGVPIILEPGQSLRMYIQDDLTELTDHFAMVQGYIL